MAQKPTKTIKKAIPLIKQRGLLSQTTGEKDSQLIQLNPRELGLLQSMLRDPGHTNPKTGLLSFDPGNRGSGGPGAGSHDGPSGGNGGPSGGGGNVTGHANGAAPGAGPPGGTSTSGGGPSGGVSRNPTHDTAVGNENAAMGVHAEGGMITGALGPDGVTRSSVDAEHDLRSSLGLSDTDSVPRTFESPFTHAVATEQSLPVKVLNFFDPFGIHISAPKIGVPSTYSMGQPNLSVNPAHLAGSAMGVALGGIPSMAIGPVAGSMYSHLGGQDVSLGGVGSTSEGSGVNGTGVASGSSPTGPQGASASGNNNSGPSTADYLGAAAGLSGTTYPNKPPTIPGLGLQNLQFQGGQYQTLPGYGFTVPTYNAWRWG